MWKADQNGRRKATPVVLFEWMSPKSIPGKKENTESGDFPSGGLRGCGEGRFPERRERGADRNPNRFEGNCAVNLEGGATGEKEMTQPKKIDDCVVMQGKISPGGVIDPAAPLAAEVRD